MEILLRSPINRLAKRFDFTTKWIIYTPNFWKIKIRNLTVFYNNNPLIKDQFLRHKILLSPLRLKNSIYFINLKKNYFKN